MKHFFLYCLLLLLSGTSFCQGTNQHLLDELNEAIGNSARYDQVKQANIAAIKHSLDHRTALGSFEGYRKLYEEFKAYNYDSAYSYSQKMLDIASRTNNDSLLNYAKLTQSFVLLSSGMFKEAFDSLNTINPQRLENGGKSAYYTLLARCYYDLADYDNDRFHTPEYNVAGSRYLDSAILLFPSGSFNFLYYNGLKHIRSAHIGEALQYFNRLMRDSTLSLHELALTTSTLSDIYIQRGQTDKAIELLVKAAIADIKSSTKETTAIFNLSTLLFKRGELKTASFYIKKAMNDAVFYGARQRKVQLSAVFSLIEGERMTRVENENRKTLIYAAAVTLLFLVLTTLIIIILHQFRKLQNAKQTITKAHLHQQEINGRLVEANKIKEEYIGYFFNGNSEIYSKIEKFKRNVERKVMDRKFEEIFALVNNFNLKQDRDELLKNFDGIFLKLFPNFIEKYNALFNEEDLASLKESNILNTDLRIFALIRLGIHDNEKIAQILGYSVHTINAYKTKIKNRSLVPNEDFEPRIMGIKSV